MRRVFPSFLFVSATVAVVPAQQVIVPSAVATNRPTRTPFYTANVFYSTTSASTAPASRSQAIVDTSDVGIPAAMWNRLQVRRPVGLSNANPMITTTATIVLSVSTAASAMATPTFATNHGANAVTVLQGPVSLPADTNPSAWPAPWQTPIPFTTPFVFVNAPGGSLVIDVHQDQGSSGSTPWYVEYTAPALGERTDNGAIPSTCRFSGGGYNSGLGWTTAGLQGTGGTWYISYQGGQMPPNQIGVGALGLQGVGGSWGSLPLPIDLAAIGAPGCNWNVSIDFSLPLQSTSTGARWPNLTIPNDPGLRGAVFYDQALFIDPAANAFGGVVSRSSKWTIAPPTGGAPGVFVYAIGNAHNGPAGTREAGGLPSYLLQ